MRNVYQKDKCSVCGSNEVITSNTSTQTFCLNCDSDFESISVEFAKKYLNIEPNFKDDDILIQTCINVAVDYVCTYTGLDKKTVISKDSILIAILLLISDFYSRRSASFGYDNNRINFMLKSILDMHKVNWL
ncbi:head-tail connector protein [Paraclostridium sordellii]|uniref:head-tail connector protein n=1 Tax=Paraclostridium sordellii TaxID=1505 RepID=UPI0005DB876F|nr:head-tail connector protein [Paeniclostridium sordellii]CEN75438.1 Phage gp6-like head-tail connector protein [[Clostridium] sordellii] [Paeniclostridium sordellii]CEO25145.1 Phage gp6-like head-tail connector protein [[Clostridium] sordellii] [Paeniclostridium sordellii]